MRKNRASQPPLLRASPPAPLAIWERVVLRDGLCRLASLLLWCSSFFLSSSLSLAQGVNVAPGTKWTLSGNELTIAGAFSGTASGEFDIISSTVKLTGNWSNYGTILAGASTVLFDGAAGNQTVDGTTIFNDLVVNKLSGELTLLTDQTINGTLTLTSGDVSLNGQMISLGPAAMLVETPGNTVKGSTGSITTTRVLNAPSSLNVAGLGATITSAANLGSTVITRRHAAATVGCAQSILRSYDITPTTNTGLDATLVFRYDDSELNGLVPATFALMKSTTSGTSWSMEGGTANPPAKSVTLAGIDAFSLWTVGSLYAGLQLAVKAYLQGPWDGSSSAMTTLLNSNSSLPTAQPYTSAPWNYAGTESVASGFFTSNPTIVDWVLIELRTGTAANTVVAKRAAFMKSNGTIVDIDGIYPVAFPAIPTGSYYVVLWHRNHLAVMSPATISIPCIVAGLTHDFSVSASSAFGIDPQQNLATGVYGLWSGDVNANGQVKYNGSANDRALIFNRIGSLTGVVSGYYPEDVNMNGQVKYNGSNNDRTIIFNNIGTLTGVRNTQVP